MEERDAGPTCTAYQVTAQTNSDPDYHLSCLLRRPQAFAPLQFAPGTETVTNLRETHVLVVGAGGLGCEVLKGLCLSGFRRIDVIDMDTINVTNLHRQFLFRESHVGCAKAQVAADVLNAQYAHLNVRVRGHVCRLEEKDEAFYRQFQLVISGLDSIEARRWLNAMIHSLAERDENGEVDLSTCIPLLDGGTEGLKGQARVIFPFVTSCFECSLSSFPPQTTYPLCTIAETPRLPKHCIEYAMLVLWGKHFPDCQFDADNPEHLEWVYDKAKSRADHFGIPGVTYRLTLGVTKRVIPAVASTNAIVAGMLVEEAVKIVTFCVCSTHDIRVAEAAVSPVDCLARASSLSVAGSDDLRTKTDGLHLSEAVAASPLRSLPSSASSSRGEEAAKVRRSRPAEGDDEGKKRAASAVPSSTCSSSAPSAHSSGPASPTEEERRSQGLRRGSAEKRGGHTEDGSRQNSSREGTAQPEDVGGGGDRAADEELSGVQNYIMYMGEASVYTHTFEYAKKPDCVVCSGKGAVKRFVDPDQTLRDLLDLLCQEPRLNLKSPSISSSAGVVFLQSPPQLRQQFEANLSKSLRELATAGLVREGEELLVTDSALPSPLRLRLVFEPKVSRLPR